MSSTFDIAQHTLSWLKEKVNSDQQATQAIDFLKLILDDLHTYSHQHGDVLNRVAGINAQFLLTVLDYDDPTERHRWLKLKHYANSPLKDPQP